MKTWLAFVAIGKSQLIERGFRDHQDRIKILYSILNDIKF